MGFRSLTIFLNLDFVNLLQTLFVAWQNGALSQSYLQTSLDKLTSQMADIESHHLAPPGWRAVWDRYDPFALLFLLFLSYQHFCVKTKHYQIITWNNVRPKNVALCAQDQLWIWRFWTFLRCASKIKEQSRNSCQIVSVDWVRLPSMFFCIFELPFFLCLFWRMTSLWF